MKREGGGGGVGLVSERGGRLMLWKMTSYVAGYVALGM